MKIVDEVDNSIIPIIATKGFLPEDAKTIGYFVEGNCILPFYIKKKCIISYMRFVTGVIGSSDIEEEKAFLNNMIEYIGKHKIVDMIIAPHTSALFRTIPDGAKYCKFGSYIVDLSLDKETLFENLHSKHRNVIRKAEKDGVIISCNNKYKRACVDLVNETALRQNLHLISDKTFEKMKNNPNIDFYVAIKDDEIQGASILEWSNYSSYYMYGGSSAHTHPGVMNYLHWSAMLDMKKRGVKRYDFVGARIKPKSGSKQEGIQRFKARFGGELKTGYIWKYSFSNVKSFIYKLYIRYIGLKNRSYTMDIIDQENEAK